MNLPHRMKMKQCIQTPEPPGCCNSGARIGIYKAPEFVEYKCLNPKGFQFVVGKSLYFTDAIFAMLHGTATHKTKHAPRYNKQYWDAMRGGHATRNVEHYCVKFYKTYASAKKAFNKLANSPEVTPLPQLT